MKSKITSVYRVRRICVSIAIHFILTLCCLFAVAPFISILIASFANGADIIWHSLGAWGDHGVSLQHYKSVFVETYIDNYGLIAYSTARRASESALIFYVTHIATALIGLKVAAFLSEKIVVSSRALLFLFVAWCALQPVYRAAFVGFFMNLPGLAATEEAGFLFLSCIYALAWITFSVPIVTCIGLYIVKFEVFRKSKSDMLILMTWLSMNSNIFAALEMLVADGLKLWPVSLIRQLEIFFSNSYIQINLFSAFSMVFIVPSLVAFYYLMRKGYIDALFDLLIGTGQQPLKKGPFT